MNDHYIADAYRNWLNGVASRKLDGLDVSILSVRARKSLVRAGIFDPKPDCFWEGIVNVTMLESPCRESQKPLGAIKNCGLTTVGEINSWCKKHGIKMDEWHFAGCDRMRQHKTGEKMGA